MGRRNERGLELTWHAPSKRWRKRVTIDGKQRDKYFGGGRGVSDRESYRAALKRYKIWKVQRDEQDEAKAVYETVVDLLRGGMAITLEELQALFAGEPEPAGARERDIAMMRSIPVIATKLDEIEQGGKPEPSSVENLFAAYQAHLDHRLKMTQSNPGAVNNADRLGESMYRTLRGSVKALQQHIAQLKLRDLDDMAKIEAALLSYRQALDEKVAAGDMQPSYCYNLIRAIRPMFQLAWQQRLIPEPPRCLDTVCRKPSTKPDAKPLTKTQIQKLWAKADDHMRCLIALGLNAGLYAIDTSDMRADELIQRDGHTYLARRRSKTKAPGRWKLWPITAKLIARVRNDQPDGRLFTAKRGGPLVRKSARSISDYVAREMLNVASAAGVKASFSQLRDTGAAFIERWGREQGDNVVTSAYLAHADRRMARNYLSTEPADLDTGKLDMATDAMASWLDLTG